MPFMEAIVNHLAGSKFWFKLDAFKGFWMMPLEDYLEMFSFMTDREFTHLSDPSKER
jgi:hypothetical protein